jgi:nitroreductase
MQLQNAIKTRRSIRAFLSKSPDWRKILRAIDLAKFAPLAGNFQTVKFILIDDKEKIGQIRDASQQDFVGKVEYVVVVVSDYEYLRKMYPEYAETYGKQQAGAVIENLLLVLHDMGMASCWVGWFDHNEVRKTLRIPEDKIIEAILPIGFELKQNLKPIKKAELENIIFFNQYGNKNKDKKAKVSVEGA